MKLRNKETGQEGNFIINKDHFECSDLEYVPKYSSLAELNEEWEDYEPAEPLIKDEKIRKAVRAWADLFGYKFVTHRFYTTTTGHRWSLLARESQEMCLPELDGLDEPKDYTIAELCGEEESEA